jgi:hypothetical protein
MAVQFNGSQKNPELEALDVLLKGKSDEYKPEFDEASLISKQLSD